MRRLCEYVFHYIIILMMMMTTTMIITMTTTVIVIAGAEAVEAAATRNNDTGRQTSFQNLPLLMCARVCLFLCVVGVFCVYVSE